MRPFCFWLGEVFLRAWGAGGHGGGYVAEEKTASRAPPGYHPASLLCGGH